VEDLLDRVSAYVYGRLASELPGDLFYHCIFHTRDMVVPAVRHLARLEGIDDRNRICLETGALYHDLGFIRRYRNNEVIAAGIAEETLPHFGFTDPEVAVVIGIIMATRMPQRPKTPLEAIMCDADLAHLGKTDFIYLNECLRRERAAHGDGMAPKAWYSDSIAFLDGHTYFTEAGEAACGPEKARNIRRLEARLATLEGGAR